MSAPYIYKTEHHIYRVSAKGKIVLLATMPDSSKVTCEVIASFRDVALRDYTLRQYENDIRNHPDNYPNYIVKGNRI